MPENHRINYTVDMLIMAVIGKEEYL